MTHTTAYGQIVDCWGVRAPWGDIWCEDEQEARLYAATQELPVISRYDHLGPVLLVEQTTTPPPVGGVWAVEHTHLVGDTNLAVPCQDHCQLRHGRHQSCVIWRSAPIEQPPAEGHPDGR